MSVVAVVGGQYGSEGKGQVAAALSHRFATHVRVGAANAGHTFYVAEEKRVLRQLPCAAYANPGAVLALGPGALISHDVLACEVDVNQRWRSEQGLDPLRLLIDRRAHLVAPEHIVREASSDLEHRIGSTSATAREGIGEAQAARVRRDQSTLTAEDFRSFPVGCEVVDVVQYLHANLDGGIFLEGTQGTGLSNTTGQYPYVTSRDVTAATLAADAGLGPRLLDEVVLVCRTFPIRVAGNSGPFWDGSRELTWEGIGQEPELTTVTGKVRRVASFSFEQVTYAARLNSATHVALTFCDYLDPAIAGCGAALDLYSCVLGPEELARYPRVASFVERLEAETGLPVAYLGCGSDVLLAYASPLESSLDQHRRLAAFRESWSLNCAYKDRDWGSFSEDDVPQLDGSGYPMLEGRYTTAPNVHYAILGGDGHFRLGTAEEYVGVHNRDILPLT